VTEHTVSLVSGKLASGQWCEMICRGSKTDGSPYESHTAGLFSHVAFSDGKPYLYFQNGVINGLMQKLFGFPASCFREEPSARHK
jgi:hypothetical protein